MTSFSTQQIHDAIYRAAASVEAQPHLWGYLVNNVPGCGTPGCAVGWIGHHLGFRRGADISLVAEAMGYPRIDEGVLFSERAVIAHIDDVSGKGWKSNASAVPSALRAYADRYYPVERKAASTWVQQPVVSWDKCDWRPSTVMPATPTPNMERV